MESRALSRVTGGLQKQPSFFRELLKMIFPRIFSRVISAAKEKGLLFCKDCRFCSDTDAKRLVCSKPPCYYDLTTGECATLCNARRQPGGDCGPEGKLFKRRENSNRVAWVPLAAAEDAGKQILCKDCESYEGNYCSRPPFLLDLTTGEIKSSFARSRRPSGGDCGPEGKLFKARHQPLLGQVGPDKKTPRSPSGG